MCVGSYMGIPGMALNLLGTQTLSNINFEKARDKIFSLWRYPTPRRGAEFKSTSFNNVKNTPVPLLAIEGKLAT